MTTFEPDPLLHQRPTEPELTTRRLTLGRPLPKYRGVGDIVGQSFVMYGRMFGLILLVALVLFLPLAVIEAALHSVLLATPGDPTLVALAVGSGLLNLALTALATPAFIYAAVIVHRENRVPALGEALRWGLVKWLPSLGWYIVVVLLTLIGCILFIIPGMFAMVLLFLVLPVVAIENGSNGDAMSRSFELTRGYRWPILGVALLMVLIYFAVGTVIGGVGGVLELTGLNVVTPFAEWLGAFVWPLMILPGVITYLCILGEQSPPAHCLTCGYSFAGNTTGHCPECGTPLPPDADTSLPD